jgi:hypothetical protein
MISSRFAFKKLVALVRIVRSHRIDTVICFMVLAVTASFSGGSDAIARGQVFGKCFIVAGYVCLQRGVDRHGKEV